MRRKLSASISQQVGGTTRTPIVSLAKTSPLNAEDRYRLRLHMDGDYVSTDEDHHYSKAPLRGVVRSYVENACLSTIKTRSLYHRPSHSNRPHTPPSP
jgi:hypothetical protein